ncbi:MAG: hypothetical protein U9Q63_02160 [Patescibacteria group bacterium]|nr:hypothetical protein [Patescibacteria group bacterium]
MADKIDALVKEKKGFMADKIKLKRGDRIIKHGKAYRIVKAAKGLIVYKPYFKKKKDNGLVCSIPAKNIEGNYIRKSISNYRLNKLIKKILYKKAKIKQVNVTKMKAVLGKNKIGKTLAIVKKLWLEQKDKSKKMTKSKKNVYKQARQRVIEEIALARDVSLQKARLVLNRALRKGFENG